MNPSKRNVDCSDCKRKVDAEKVVCLPCLEKAQNDAYDSGSEDGITEGEKKGYDKGHDDGYTEGYAQAIEDATRKVEEAFGKLKP